MIPERHRLLGRCGRHGWGGTDDAMPRSIATHMGRLLPLREVLTQSVEPMPARRTPRLWHFPLRRPGELLQVQSDGLVEPSFYAWRRALGERDQQAAASAGGADPAEAPPVFVPLHVVPTAATALELVLDRGRTVRVPAGFDAGTLRQLLAVLEEPSC